ncbi:glycosyltransferase family 4 protein [Clostridium sp. WILCCON 0269]|uniref:Glycosyltransferase family 4 protein n=1 Tax=Candidatus Clostridium eludens TaxID=3381663 RepID=A0ABW8SF34_9CLOT
MKILMVNKFLYPNGGSETYMFKLGQYLTSLGHEVQYFGMADEKNIVSNSANSYTSNVDFYNGKKLSKLTYPFKIIYSREARKKIAVVLDNFKPDIVHMNNINFQLTPSIFYEIKKCDIALVQTVHDSQIACPNHRLYIESKGTICEKCLNGKYTNCLKEKCMQSSSLKSAIMMFESIYYHKRNTYNLVDKYICPSNFIAEKIRQGGVEKDRTTVLYNFSDKIEKTPGKIDSQPYALYFGRLSKEKGILTLISVCKELSKIKFVFAGVGPLTDELEGIDNIEFVGFKNGSELQSLISNAEFSLYPSEWYENCPLSVIESQALGTPVIGSDLGGTRELIETGKTGLIFEGCSKSGLKDAILKLWADRILCKQMKNECLSRKSNTIDIYTEKLMKIYKSVISK